MDKNKTLKEVTEKIKSLSWNDQGKKFHDIFDTIGQILENNNDDYEEACAFFIEALDIIGMEIKEK
jgi:hypothetical protein